MATGGSTSGSATSVSTRELPRPAVAGEEPGDQQAGGRIRAVASVETPSVKRTICHSSGVMGAGSVATAVYTVKDNDGGQG